MKIENIKVQNGEAEIDRRVEGLENSAKKERDHMGINVRFTDEDWARIERDWTAFWAGELDRPLVVMTGFEPDGELPEVPPFVPSLPMSMPAEEVVDRYGKHLEAQRFYGDAFPKWFVNFGPGIMAGFLGSKVGAAPDTVWFDPPEGASAHRLDPRYDPQNVWWQRVRDITRCAAEAWQDRVCVSITDLGGNLDVAASLLSTEQLLTDLHDAPEQIDRVVGKITGLWMRYYDELYDIVRRTGRGSTPWAPIWSPGKCYMLQSDFAYMISPAMFERFVMPDLRACCEFLDHGFYHLDGKGQLPHLDMLLEMENLWGVQWIPGDGNPPADRWPAVLRRIRDAGKLCQMYVDAEGARRIVREIGGKGFIFQVGWDGLSRADAEGFLATLMRDSR